MKILSLSVILAFLFTTSTVVSQPIFTVSGSASGAQETPPNASLGTATFSGQYDQATKMITLNIPFSGLNSNTTGSHIHAGALGMAGPVIIPLTLPPPSTSGVITGTYAVAPVNEAALLAGDTYVNIHTAMQPGGEIRGQLILTPPLVPTLGEWSILILGLLIVIMGVVFIYQYKSRVATVTLK